MTFKCVIFLNLILTVWGSSLIEFENFQGVGDVNIIHRSNASQGTVVHLLYDKMIKFEMCIHSPVDVQIQNIVFSNEPDKVGDIISIDIDGIPIGRFSTMQSSEAYSNWNIFHNTGVIGDIFRLDYGQHLLTLHVLQSDEFGVELDYIELNMGNRTVNPVDLPCSVYCFNDINFRSLDLYPIDIEGFRIQQFSKPTVCSEEENVKVAIYHDSAKNFDIKATRPKYASCSNRREPDFRGCNLASPAWVFRDVPLVSSKRIHVHRASLLVDVEHPVIRVGVTFDMSGFSTTRGQGESRTAGKVFIRFGKLMSNVRVVLSYKGKAGTMLAENEITINPEAPYYTWTLKDDIWGLDDGNNIILQLRGVESTNTPVSIEELRLEKREMKDEVFTLYNDGIFVWEGVHRESWWLSHQQTLSLDVIDGDRKITFDDVDNIRLYMKKPFGDGFSQIFVINNDGHSRIQPVPPHGMDWTPFGSSLVIGPNMPYTLRPYASIKKVELDGRKMILYIRYHDDSSVALKIIATPSETMVQVRNYTVANDRSDRSLLTFVSTWLQDGYSNVDTIALDGKQFVGKIIDRFGQNLNGTNINFFRKCISQLNTQSPDIEIALREQSSGLEE